MAKHNNENSDLDDIEIFEDRFLDKSKNDSLAKKQPVSKKNKGKKRKKKKSKKKMVIIAAIIAIVAILLVMFAFVTKQHVDYLKGRANDLKTELFATIECVKNNDPDGAEEAMVQVRDISQNISDNLDYTFWSVMSKMPIVSGDINSVKEALKILSDADKEIITPLIEEIRVHPFSGIKKDNGINVASISSYLDFAESIAPNVIDLSNRLSNLDFKLIKMKSIEDYKEKFAVLASGFDNIDSYKDLISVVIGNGEDRTFLVMAQNTSEIRSCGGFPGACGLLEIKNGILEMKDFGTVENYISYGSPVDTGTTAEEGAVFGSDYLYQDRDASYNPHFPKVASITKASYEGKTGNKIVGVISLTPAVIQDILGITNETLTLDDGTEVNKDNAAMVLQHDLYYKYYGIDDGWMANDDIVNKLFAQTASLTMSSMTRNMNIESLIGFSSMLNKCFNNRTIMIWSENESDEQILKAAGASGSLNYETEKPETGIFFSNSTASKMGMFVDIDYTLSEPTKNDKGQLEYQMEVKLINTATADDLIISSYVKGNDEGTIHSYIYLFAPKGGNISNITFNNGVEAHIGNLYDLNVAYVHDMRIEPGETITINYTVTTAIGVENKLKVVKTPTLQEFR